MARRFCKISTNRQNKLLEMFVAGIPARTAADPARVNRNSATLFYHKSRNIIAYELEDESPFDGQVDESYFCGQSKGKRARGAAGKIPVSRLLKRNGKVYAKVIPDASTETPIPIIERKVLPDSVVYSNSWRAYNAFDLKEFHPIRAFSL